METNNLILFDASPGVEVRAALTRLSRYDVVFEVYDPHTVFRISQVLERFRILLKKQAVYEGRAVISSTVNTGRGWLCEAALEESWRDIDLSNLAPRAETLRTEFDHFLRITQQNFKVRSEFKVVVADMQSILMDLRQWLDQVPCTLLSGPDDKLPDIERAALDGLKESLYSPIEILFERFEEISAKIEKYLQPVHKSYARRFLHPIVLCSPFVFRTFRKPLGYAGDYEMVNMMLRDPYEGRTLFAKALNAFFLGTPPVVAHRHRIVYLTQLLISESQRRSDRGAPLRVFNIGCGPAKEVQEFMRQSDLSDRAQFTLLDFNDETVAYTTRVLSELKQSLQRRTKIELIKKSVTDLLRESLRNSAQTPRYDFVYCAGLFDYLADQVCQKLISFFYEMLTPGGLLAVTNVEQSNPSQNSMEYVMDWHLVYRTPEGLMELGPKSAPPETTCIKADITGLNIFLEARKP